MSDLTAVSLFAGIEGFGLALERAGITVKAAVEIDPACRGIIRRHFPQTKIFNDVTEVTGDQLRAAGLVPGRGIITAGWPCQGNSVAGRRKGMADPRSGLWRHVVRLLAEARPRWFIGENVPGLLSINGGRDFGAVLGDLDDLGYGVAWRVLDASGFGVPQRRRRVFIAGCLGDPAGPVEVLLEPESRDGHPSAGPRPGTRVAGTLAASAGSAGLGGAGQSASAITSRLVETASTLQGGGRRGHRVDAEGAAGGHLVPVVTETLRSHPRPGSNTSGAIIPVALRGRDGGGQIEAGEPGDPAFTVRTPGGGSSYPMIAHVAATLSAGTAAGEGVRPPGRRLEDDVNLVTVTPLLEVGARTGASTDDPKAGVGIGDDGDGDPMFTLQAGKQHGIAVTALGGEGVDHALTSEGADASEDGTGRGTPIVAYALTSRNDRNDREENWITAPIVPGVAGISENQRGEVLETPYSRQLTTGGGKPGQGYGAVREGTAVRRLTPMECERLMGLPDEWTRWLDDGTEQSDSARYRECGNSVAVPVVQWIADRVVAVDSALEAVDDAAS